MNSFVELDPGTIQNMFRCWDSGIDMPHKQFLEYSDGLWTCVDNRQGCFYMEAFRFIEDALHYLKTNDTPQSYDEDGHAVFFV